MSVIAAILAKYDALAFPVAKPPMYFYQAPTRDAAGALLLLPWVVLEDRGMRIEYPFEYNPYEVTTVEVSVYHVQLTDADAVANGIKYGTNAATQQGFDFGVLTTSPQTFKECKRVNEIRDLQPVQTETVQLCHRVILTYEISTAYQW